MSPQAMITGTFPESICSACRTGQAHSLRIHAKILMSMADILEAETPVLIQQQEPHIHTSDPSYRTPRPTPPPTMPPQGDADVLDADELDSVLTRATAPARGVVVPLLPQSPKYQPPAALPVVRVARPAAVVY